MNQCFFPAHPDPVPGGVVGQPVPPSRNDKGDGGTGWKEALGGMARVRQGQQSVVAGGGEALEFSYIVGGDAQGNALGENAHVIAENSNACTGGAWVSQGGAVSEVVGGRLIEGPKEGEELPVFHISLA